MNLKNNKMNQLDKNLKLKMKYSIFNGKSYYGYKPSVLKSGICKYYRRQQFDKFEWCVIEMFLFSIESQGKALITNLINRLKILIMEEISPTETDNIHKLIKITKI